MFFCGKMFGEKKKYSQELWVFFSTDMYIGRHRDHVKKIVKIAENVILYTKRLF